MKEIRFSYEEAELINGFLEGAAEVTVKEALIKDIVGAKENTEDPELLIVADSALEKLQEMSEESYSNMVKNLPVDTYSLH